MDRTKIEEVLLNYLLPPELVTAIADDIIKGEREVLTAAYHALRSYQHGNSSPELAKEIADRLEPIVY